MKSKVLFLAMMLIGLTSAIATTAGDAVLNGEDFNNTRYRYTQPISFVERGVEFLIFTDGTFDFNTEPSFSTQQNGNIYYRGNRSRRSLNSTIGAPGTTRHFGSRGIIITHDRLGRVRRVGNVFINYDRQGRIKRAGTVYMSYRRGLLKQIGGLYIQYNRQGRMIGTRGVVNFNNRNNWDIDHNWNDEDDYYYHKNNRKHKKLRIHNDD